LNPPVAGSSGTCPATSAQVKRRRSRQGPHGGKGLWHICGTGPSGIEGHRNDAESPGSAGAEIYSGHAKPDACAKTPARSPDPHARCQFVSRRIPCRGTYDGSALTTRWLRRRPHGDGRAVLRRRPSLRGRSVSGQMVARLDWWSRRLTVGRFSSQMRVFRWGRRCVELPEGGGIGATTADPK
jgi:hypothetical protein